jgi:hypothetical protein
MDSSNRVPPQCCLFCVAHPKEGTKKKQNKTTELHTGTTHKHKRRKHKNKTGTTHRQQTTHVEERNKALLEMFAVVVVVVVAAGNVHVTAVDISTKEFFESNSFDFQGT